MVVLAICGEERKVRHVLKYGACERTHCGKRVDVVDYNRVLKLFFFIPVWRWPASDPLFYCANCPRRRRRIAVVAATPRRRFCPLRRVRTVNMCVERF
ncbi:hypothetical protein E2542_SST20579 [Spatholobus suberectus]|nr:hypothetical protein E2542_SST20579 [Spatholobus suberectus]